MTETVLWRESADYGDTPNVVNLNIPRSGQNEGAAWVYLPSKDTVYIGPQGSYHMDIAHTLKTLVDKKKNEKPITGVQYEDGYVDYFDGADEKTIDRILHALQTYHNENYGADFNKAEDDAGAWDDSGGYYVYPDDADYEDPDEDDPSYNGLDTAPSKPSLMSWEKAHDPAEYRTMKPTPGMENKPIHSWDVQDYIDWRDKKYWQSRGYYSTPREDYPHFRWSYGDSQILKGGPHEGLWVWPTQNGYPAHFDQTGQAGLGNCAQGRIYPHQGDRWEILTWPGRPRNAPSQAVREYLQEEAQRAVKEYVMDKIGVPEDKIFFTNMHYSAAVMGYNSPSYPQDDYSTPKTYKPEPFHYDWEPLKDWTSIPEGSFHKLKDPEGNIWTLSTLEPDKPGHIRFYNAGFTPHKTIEIDPNTTPVDGWEIGSKVYDKDTPSVPATTTEKNENPYDWKPEENDSAFDQQAWGPNKTIQDTYDRYQQQKALQGQGTLPLGKPGDKQSGPPPSVQVQMHKNPDGSLSKIGDLKAGPALFNWDGNDWTVRHLTPEEAYAIRVQWHEEDEAKRKDIARTMFPEAFGDAGDELDENGEFIPPTSQNYDPMKQLQSFQDPSSGNIIHVPASDYELAYKLHGDNWWKSFIPNRNLTSSADPVWKEVI